MQPVQKNWDKDGRAKRRVTLRATHLQCLGRELDSGYGQRPRLRTRARTGAGTGTETRCVGYTYYKSFMEEADDQDYESLKDLQLATPCGAAS